MQTQLLSIFLPHDHKNLEFLMEIRFLSFQIMSVVRMLSVAGMQLYSEVFNTVNIAIHHFQKVGKSDKSRTKQKSRTVGQYRTSQKKSHIRPSRTLALVYTSCEEATNS